MNYDNKIQNIDDEIKCLRDRMTELQTKIYLSKKVAALSSELQILLDELRREWRKKLLEKSNLDKGILNNNLKGGRRK